MEKSCKYWLTDIKITLRNLLNEWDAVFEMVPSNPCFATHTLKDFPPLECGVDSLLTHSLTY